MPQVKRRKGKTEISLYKQEVRAFHDVMDVMELVCGAGTTDQQRKAEAARAATNSLLAALDVIAKREAAPA